MSEKEIGPGPRLMEEIVKLSTVSKFLQCSDDDAMWGAGKILECIHAKILDWYLDNEEKFDSVA